MPGSPVLLRSTRPIHPDAPPTAAPTTPPAPHPDAPRPLPLLAQPTEPAPVAPPVAGDDLRIPEVFTSHLPQTLRDGTWRLSVHPHLGDLKNRDFLRISTGLRQGPTAKWEASAGTEFYLSHDIGEVGFGKQIGLSTQTLGTKYDLGSRPIAGWETAVGFDFATPVSRPPAELTDGMRHHHPYLTSSHRLQSHPEIRLFWGLGVDLVSHTDLPRELHKNQLDDSTTELNAGAVWDHHSRHYTFEVAWESTRLVGHRKDDTLTLRPGVIWEVPWFRGRQSDRIVRPRRRLAFQLRPRRQRLWRQRQTPDQLRSRAPRTQHPTAPSDRSAVARRPSESMPSGARRPKPGIAFDAPPRPPTLARSTR